MGFPPKVAGGPWEGARAWGSHRIHHTACRSLECSQPPEAPKRATAHSPPPCPSSQAIAYLGPRRSRGGPAALRALLVLHQLLPPLFRGADKLCHAHHIQVCGNQPGGCRGFC